MDSAVTIIQDIISERSAENTSNVRAWPRVEDNSTAIAQQAEDATTTTGLDLTEDSSTDTEFPALSTSGSVTEMTSFVGSWFLRADVINIIVLSLITLLGLSNARLIHCILRYKKLRTPFNFVVLCE